MTIRFLQTCPSENPDYPFVAGQEFTFTGPPPPVFAKYLDGVQAFVLRADPVEHAVAARGETPEPYIDEIHALSSPELINKLRSARGVRRRKRR